MLVISAARVIDNNMAISSLRYQAQILCHFTCLFKILHKIIRLNKNLLELTRLLKNELDCTN